jgi:Fe-S oxidoreductase
MIRWGYAAQRLGHRAMRRWLTREGPPPVTTGKARMHEQVVHFLDRPMPGGLRTGTMRSLLGLQNAGHVPILRDPATTDPDSEAVFYFPGCGSERLFSQIGLASLAMLYHQGVQTILPPGYLCCGYPQTAGGDAARGTAISVANRVLFHRIANTLNHLDIRTVLVSCGTCMDQLLQYEFQRIFPGCRLLDIHEFLMERGVRPAGETGVRYLYHAPCHDPMKHHDGTRVASELMGREVAHNDRCCGESGTFAVARPDIATQVKFRKQEEILRGVTELGAGQGEAVKILTSCPSCHQGLSRYTERTGVESEYIVVELARRNLGNDWQQAFIAETANGGIEHVML